MQTTDQDLLPESAVQMTEQDLFGAIQTLVVHVGGRAFRRPRRRAPRRRPTRTSCR